MSYYVNKDAYRGAVRAATRILKTDAAAPASRRGPLDRLRDRRKSAPVRTPSSKKVTA
jgi:hypothetical protein